MATAYNRAYQASLRFAQILLRKTSDTLGTLSEIAFNKTQSLEDVR